MIRIYQTIRSNGAQQGDCFRCCLASLLDLRAYEVPHFYAGGENGGYTNAEEDRALNAWLKLRGLSYFETGFKSSLYGVLQGMGHNSPDLAYILAGNTANGSAHSVVCRGNQVIHDPAHEIIADPVPYPCKDQHYHVGIIAKYL